MATRALLFAPAVLAAAAAVLVGCAGPAARQPAFTPAQALFQPQSHLLTPAICGTCCPHELDILPETATIKAGQQITLVDEYDFERFFHRCGQKGVDAVWTTSGGSLQVINGGTEAVFSASSAGVYYVAAQYRKRTGKATMTVTLPLERK